MGANGGSRKKGSSGKRFELTKYLLKLFFLVEIIKSNILNVKGLASEEQKLLFNLIFRKILRFTLTQTFLLIPRLQVHVTQGKIISEVSAYVFAISEPRDLSHAIGTHCA